MLVAWRVRPAVLLAAVLCGCGPRGRPLPAGDHGAEASRAGTDWVTVDPAAAGVDGSRLDLLTATLRRYPHWNVHAILLEQDGRLVYEAYFDGLDEHWGEAPAPASFDQASLHDLRSVSKSVVSALVGLAIADGKIPSLDTPTGASISRCSSTGPYTATGGGRRRGPTFRGKARPLRSTRTR